MAELSVEWLSEVLDQQVTGFTTQQIVDEGYASRMYRVSVQSEVPKTYILKLATTQAAQRDLLDADVMAREVVFYQDLAHQLTDRSMLPETHYANIDRDRLQLTLLMEDLGDIPHKPWRENLENSLAAIDALARIQACFWESPQLSEPRFAPAESSLDQAALVSLLEENLAAEAAADYSYPYLRDCMLHLRKLSQWLTGETDQFPGAMTLVHGDFHTRNIHFDNGRVVVFDWQVTERGRPARDLVYWLLTCVDVEDVKDFRPQLVDRYLQVLKECGIDYSNRAFQRDYHDAVLQLVPRMYCYQTLVTFSDTDRHELGNFLDRTDAMAKSRYMRAQMRIARVVAPALITVLRWLGKR